VILSATAEKCSVLPEDLSGRGLRAAGRGGMRAPLLENTQLALMMQNVIFKNRYGSMKRRKTH
jgi:hypothetical protein